MRGVTTHAECWKAFGGDYRSDPGEHYPVAEAVSYTHLTLPTSDLV